MEFFSARGTAHNRRGTAATDKDLHHRNREMIAAARLPPRAAPWRGRKRRARFQHAVDQQYRPYTDDSGRRLQDHHFARTLEAPIGSEPDKFGFEIETFAAQAPHLIGGENKGAGQHGHRDIRAAAARRAMRRASFFTPGCDLGGGIRARSTSEPPRAARKLSRSFSPVSAKRTFKLRASGGGLESRVMKGLSAPAFKVGTPTSKVQ